MTKAGCFSKYIGRQGMGRVRILQEQITEERWQELVAKGLIPATPDVTSAELSEVSLQLDSIAPDVPSVRKIRLNSN